MLVKLVQALAKFNLGGWHKTCMARTVPKEMAQDLHDAEWDLVK
jgi:hypothetical protein